VGGTRSSSIAAFVGAIARARAALLVALAVISAFGTGCDDCGKTSHAYAEATAAPRPASSGKRFLKGQLHAHSNGSGDSDTDPEEVAAYYALHGFDFLAITDHDRITQTTAPPGLLLVPGVELTQNLRRCDPPPLPGDACLLHVNALFVAKSPLPLRWEPLDSPSRELIYGRAVDRARALGGIAQLNHPNFHGGASLDLVLALAKRGLVLLEVENRALDSDNEGHAGGPSTEALWDAVLTRGARVWGTASDDAHHYGDAAAVRARGELAYEGDRGFVMVRAELDEASVRAAIEQGDFYGSTGLLFDRLEISRDAIVAEVHDDGRGGAITLELVGPSGVVERASGLSLRVDPRASHQPFSHERYLRVRARDERGRRAFSQPLFR
jgi:hypothetical protein